jgi:hypothetical protein
LSQYHYRYSRNGFERESGLTFAKYWIPDKVIRG